MSCVDTSHLAMRKFADTWFIKHIPSRKFFKFDGAMAVLWDALLAYADEETAIEAFLRYFDGSLEAKQDAPRLIDALRQHGLINRSQLSPLISPLPESSYVAINPQHDIQEDMYHTALELGKPLLVEYEITYRCNLRCVHCYQPNYLKHEHRSELSHEEISTMLNDFASAGVFFLTITGGECTLVPNFCYVIQQARANFMDVTVFTNGTTLKPQIIEFLSDKVVSEVKVSIYGSSASEYMYFTQVPSAFAQVMDNLVRLRDAGLHVVAKIVVTSVQENTFHETLVRLRNLGIETEVSCHIMPAMDGDNYPLKYRVSTTTLTRLFRDNLISVGNRRRCTAGTAKFRVSPDGLVTACELVRTPLGNVRERKILNILASSKSRDIVSILSKSVARATRNPETFLLPCPALGKLEHGCWEVPAAEAIKWTTTSNNLKDKKI